MNKTIRIGITIGDPAGIGSEVTLKAIKRFKIPFDCTLYVFGDRAVLKKAGLKGNSHRFNLIDSNIITSSQFKMGRLSKTLGYASYRYLSNAVKFIKQGTINCLVTAAVNKQAISLNRIKFIGHTEFLAKSFGVKKYAMIFIAKGIRASVVTRHIALSNVSKALNRNSVKQVIYLTNEALRNDFKIKKPKIAVLGLNPHASDGGLIGNEEKVIISPAINDLKTKLKSKCSIFGPLAPDTVFHRVVNQEFDAVVCMYHDQALIPFKMLHFFDGINYTAGLPFVRTSCDHGTAFEIAGKNKADYHSMLGAINLAYNLTKNRLNH